MSSLHCTQTYDYFLKAQEKVAVHYKIVAKLLKVLMTVVIQALIKAVMMRNSKLMLKKKKMRALLMSRRLMKDKLTMLMN